MTRSIKSAERTLRLFELFAARQTRLTVTEVARGLDMPQPSVSMLLADLVRLGYLDYRRRGRDFAPTTRVLLLRSWVGPCLRDGRSLAAQLDDLHRAVGEDVVVGVQNGSWVQIVMARGRARDLSIDAGRMDPLTASAAGQALLAAKPHGEVIRLVRSCNAEAEPHFQVREGRYLALIEAARRNGFAYQSADAAPRRAGLCVCIPHPGDGAAFAVGCDAPTQRIAAKREAILQGLRALQAAYQTPGPPRDADGLEAWSRPPRGVDRPATSP